MLPPQTVLQGRYSVIRPLGSGGMGSVYLANDARFHNTVALKATRFVDGEMRHAFEREAHLLRHLRHPSLPIVIDYFEEGGAAYLVMDYVPGEDLMALLKARGGSPFPPEQVAGWGCDVLVALSYLHAHNPPILHRDVKPHNIKLTPEGRVVLLDFGLAKGFAAQMAHFEHGESVQAYTPHYAALEQIQGTGTTARSDIYSTGATLYHLMTGIVPPDSLKRAMASVAREPDPLLDAAAANPHVLQPFADVLARALALSPADRFATADDFSRALRAAATRQSETVQLNYGRTTPATPVSPNHLQTRHSTVAETRMPAANDTVVETHMPPSAPPWRALAFGLGGLVVLAVGVSLAAWVLLAGSPSTVPASNQSGPIALRSTGAPPEAPARFLVGHTGQVASLAWSPNGRMIASASYDKTVKVWDSNGSLVMTFVHPEEPIRVAWDASGNEVASASLDGKVRVWNVATGAARLTLSGHTDRVLGLSWAPAAYALVSSGADGTIRLWNTNANGTLERTLTGHSKYVTSVAWGPDRQTIASGDTDGTIKLWNGFTGEFLRDLEPYPNDFSVLAWSPDGQLLAAGGDGSIVAIHDVVSGRRIRMLRGHAERVKSIAWSPDGKRLVSCEVDSNALFLWDVESGTLLAKTPQSDGQPGSLAWSPDGKTLVVGYGYGAIKLLDAGAIGVP